MGEDPRGGTLNMLPVLGNIATGKLKQLMIFGNGEQRGFLSNFQYSADSIEDYETRDGTMIRDFIHVEDVAEGHIRALSYLQSSQPGVRAWNLGSGNGTTVLEMLQLFQKTTGQDIPSTIIGRRAGDVTNLTAKPIRATEELGWQTRQSVEAACEDLWRWITNNPNGYDQEPPTELIEAIRDARAQTSARKNEA